MKELKSALGEIYTFLMVNIYTQSQRKNLQSPGKNIRSYLGDKVEVKYILKMLC